MRPARNVPWPYSSSHVGSPERLTQFAGVPPIAPSLIGTSEFATSGRAETPVSTSATVVPRPLAPRFANASAPMTFRYTEGRAFGSAGVAGGAAAGAAGAALSSAGAAGAVVSSAGAAGAAVSVAGSVDP